MECEAVAYLPELSSHSDQGVTGLLGFHVIQHSAVPNKSISTEPGLQIVSNISKFALCFLFLASQ